MIATIAGLVLLTGVGVWAWQRIAGDLRLRLPLDASCLVSRADTAPAAKPASGASGAGRGGEVALNGTQLANAATIAAVGIRRGAPARAVLVALATALQESKLENLPSGDRDSVGLFQQRPSYGWGRPDQLSDPRYAANAFYAALDKIPDWDGMRVTEAAQAVQHSGHPEAYEQWSGQAQVLADALTGAASGAVTCTVERRPAERGAAAAQALASNLRLDWGEVRTLDVGDVPGLAVSVRSQRTGWQYAHWLVAHAEQRGIKRIRFADREWTAKRATWQRVPSSTPASAERVEAEVYTS